VCNTGARGKKKSDQSPTKEGEEKMNFIGLQLEGTNKKLRLGNVGLWSKKKTE